MADLQEINYLDQARERITEQFKNSPNLDTLMNIWLQGYQNLQSTALDVQLINDVDTAQGYQLDVIGDIVGQPRILVDIAASGYFGFEEDPGAESFGSLENGAGGIWYSLGDPLSGTVELNDSFYRAFIKAKIISNNAGGTPEEVILSASQLFQTDSVELLENATVDDEPAAFTLSIGRPWNNPQQTVFPGLDETQVAERLLPKPAGVRIEYIDTLVQPTLNAVAYWVNASDRLYEVANITYPNLIGTNI